MDFKTLQDKILPFVYKPGRYTGGEYNSYAMKENALNFALAFPDTYEVGMSHLGAKIIYGLLNDSDDINCERVFAPLPDMAQKLREYSLPLYTLETYKPLSEFDFVGFSLQYEMCLTTVLYMLDLAGIPLKASERGENCPLIIGGGPCTVNPAPFCDFFDLMVIGEAEEVLPELIRLKKSCSDKKSYLAKAALLPGVYVPGFTAGKVERAYIRNMDSSYFPEKIIVPYLEPIHDRIAVEVMRGCPRGCRFCQAGYIYRPVRQKKTATVLKQAQALLDTTGYEQVSLLSLSTTDYRGCLPAVRAINEKYADKKVTVSLPSLRIDKFSLDLAREIKTVRSNSLTFAPEAGSQRMRDIINKNISEDDIFTGLEEAFRSGYSKIKLYFMIGLPYENDEDVIAIAELAQRINDLYVSLNLKPRFPTISVSVACFVPKPHTPFEFCPQNSADEFIRKQELLKSHMNKRIKFSYHHPHVSLLEGAFARGGAALNNVLLAAYGKGCVFDSWDDYFQGGKWLEAFSENGISIEDFACKAYEDDEQMPWDYIDTGVDKSFLAGEYRKSRDAATTPDCFKKCSACGISSRYGRCDFEI